ncbi:MAG: aminotransferase class I/II-fold pyridoxal phosphate-dependent enzyme [Lachnospiraceae bacterium]|nr:aminotransferase class I/II-fold pyridoxal phosphate-dependent enzyme [Lachnospiraceae bacterium]
MDRWVPLYEKLEALKSNRVYPFHMPGHKRRGMEEFLRSMHPEESAAFACAFDDILRMDITEVEPFDDLNHPTGELKAAMERCASFYGAQETFFLVNGSTSGICAAIDAVCNPGDEILMARNSHISVYRQVLHGKLTPAYLYPQELVAGDALFFGAITPQELERGLIEHPDAKAVLVVSPTYDGILSDISALAQLAHAHHKMMIVDEAHGAHLNYIRPELSAVRAGADLVIQSVHKTLPAMTQTALLHRCSDRVDAQKLRDSVAYFTSTSPSYVLVAALLRCLNFMEKYGEAAMNAFYTRLEAFYKRCEDLPGVSLFGSFWGNASRDTLFSNGWCKDPSKIVILCPKRGYALAEYLRDAQIETEAASPDMVLALASLFDSDEGFDRLYEALAAYPVEREAAVQSVRSTINVKEVSDAYRAEQVLTPFEAYHANAEATSIKLTQAAGRTSANTVYVYPPGIPQIVCGERITQGAIDHLMKLQEAGATLRGMTTEDRITVLTI